MSISHTALTKTTYKGPYSFGDAVSADIIGAVSNRPKATDEARRLCGMLEYAYAWRKSTTLQPQP